MCLLPSIFSFDNKLPGARIGRVQCLPLSIPSACCRLVFDAQHGDFDHVAESVCYADV